MTTDSYPEHEKLQEISHLSNAIGQFIEWLSGHGYQICEYLDMDDEEGSLGDPTQGYFPVYRSITSWLEEYFEIDGAVIEREKRQMLAQIRGESEEGS